jgi:hypothetical protein
MLTTSRSLRRSTWLDGAPQVYMKHRQSAIFAPGLGRRSHKRVKELSCFAPGSYTSGAQDCQAYAAASRESALPPFC